MVSSKNSQPITDFYAGCHAVNFRSDSDPVAAIQVYHQTALYFSYQCTLTKRAGLPLVEDDLDGKSAPRACRFDKIERVFIAGKLSSVTKNWVLIAEQANCPFTVA
jgi:hypothetical protein